MNEMMKIVAGLDIGNGYVKGKAQVNGGSPMLVDLPSVVSYTPGVNIPKEPSDAYMASFENEMDATVVSRAVKGIDAGRVFFGQRAIITGENQREFNIEDRTPKCKDALSTLLILGSIASVALRSYWSEHGCLPEQGIFVDACIGIALPIEDFRDWKDVYAGTLMSDDHCVTVHNFEHNIDVKVHFSGVEPIAEGAAAQYAITTLGADFLQDALDEARSMGANIDSEYTGQLLATVENTIGIDIGEGTTNFPVFVDGDVRIESSKSINKGYGTVLTAAVEETRGDKGLTFESRKDLAEFMLDTSMVPVKRQKRATMQRYIDEQVKLFARNVLTEFSTIFRKVGARTDAVYVYGGGANNVRSVLYPMLIEAIADDSGNSIPVIYLDSIIGRDLNRTGLYEVAQLTSTLVWGTPMAE